MKLDADRVCFQWTRVRLPDSGCYQLVQTAADQFTLRGVNQQRPISYSARE
jgi:trimethylamine:corrinoid methyltransferase-like protein